jgi:hypothetical protein
MEVTQRLHERLNGQMQAPHMSDVVGLEDTSLDGDGGSIRHAGYQLC